MYSKEQKIKIFESLPEDLKEAIVSTETTTKTREISDKNSLMLDQLSELVDEINLLILGLTKTKDFTSNISKRLNIPYDQALSISKDVNTNILDSIRSSLQKVQDKYNEPSPPPPRPVIKAPSVTTVPQNNTKNENVYTKPVEQQNIEIVPTEPIKTENVQDISRKEIGEIEKMGNFTIDKHESEGPQFEDQMEKEDMMKVIEEPENVVEHLLPSGVSGGSNKKEPIVIKTVPGQKNDPYREPLI